MTWRRSNFQLKIRLAFSSTERKKVLMAELKNEFLLASPSLTWSTQSHQF